MMQVFQAIFLARACLNSTLPSSTYHVMFHCLPLSSIFYNIWFPLPHSFSPLSILSQQFPDTIARHCCHHHHAYVESIWCDYGMVEAESPFKLLPHPYYTHLQSVWAHWYPSAYGRSLSQLYPPYFAQILRFCVTTGVNMMMMSLCHGSGWQPPQSASSIHIRHIQSVWAHWYAVHWRTVTALNSYTHPSWLRFWGSVSLVESKWCQHVVVEAKGHLSNCFPHPYYTHLQRVWAH